MDPTCSAIVKGWASKKMVMNFWVPEKGVPLGNFCVNLTRSVLAPALVR